MHIDLSRRRFNVALASFAACGVPTMSRAQARVDIARIIVGYAPGGSADIISRKLAQRLSGAYARSVLVENRPGAAGRLGVQAIKSLPADGSVMLITPASVLTLYPHIYKQLGYDVFADLTPVAIVASFSFALVVGPAVPASVVTLDDFVKWCKASPAIAQCANAGAGSLPHFLANLFARETAIELTHVHYSGGSLRYKRPLPVTWAQQSRMKHLPFLWCRQASFACWQLLENRTRSYFRTRLRSMNWV